MFEKDIAKIAEGLDWLGYGDDANPTDCDICDDGSVYYGLVQILPKGSVDPDEVSEEFDPETPVGGDYTITPGGRLGGMSAVGVIEGKFVGLYDCDDDALRAIKAKCDEEQYWPNIWFVSDHGNWSLYEGESE
jgi:hypothetical protein